MNTRQASVSCCEACNRLAPCYDHLVRLMGLCVGSEGRIRQGIIDQLESSPGDGVLKPGWRLLAVDIHKPQGRLRYLLFRLLINHRVTSIREAGPVPAGREQGDRAPC